MPRDLGDLAVSVSGMPEALKRGQATGVRKAAIRTVMLVRDEIRTVTGDMRLSGVGRAGAKVGATAKKSNFSTEADPAWEVKATGPLHLIELDTSPHPIYPKGLTFSTTRRGNVRRRGTTKALKIGDDFRMYADHPGTRGQHPFAKGVAKARPETTRIFQEEIRREVARSWT